MNGQGSVGAGFWWDHQQQQRCSGGEEARRRRGGEQIGQKKKADRKWRGAEGHKRKAEYERDEQVKENHTLPPET